MTNLVMAEQQERQQTQLTKDTTRALSQKCNGLTDLTKN